MSEVKVAQSCPALCNSTDCPRNFPGQNTGVGSLCLLQGISPTQGWNPGLPHCRRILHQLSHQRRPWGRRVFANVIKLRMTTMGHYPGLSKGLKFNHKHPDKREADSGDLTCIEGQKGMWRQRQRLEWCRHKHRIASSHWQCHNLIAPQWDWRWTSVLQNWGTPRCCFKPPSSWLFARQSQEGDRETAQGKFRIWLGL